MNRILFLLLIPYSLFDLIDSIPYLPIGYRRMPQQDVTTSKAPTVGEQGIEFNSLFLIHYSGQIRNRIYGNYINCIEVTMSMI